jgi:hypothetical protein
MLFLTAVALLTLGHIFRIARWSYLLTGYAHASKSAYFLSLGLGYFFNYILPFRLGEIIRAGTFGKLAKCDFLFVLATIVIERLIDVFFLLVFFLTIYAWSGDVAVLDLLSNDSFVALLGLGASVVVIFGVLNMKRAILGRPLLSAVSIFSPSVKLKILHFFWSLVVVVREQLPQFPVRFLSLTIVMWAAYFSSVYVLSISLEHRFVDVLNTIYLSLSTALPLVRNTSNNGDLSQSMIILYSIAPVGIFMLYFFSKKNFKALVTGRVGQILTPLTHMSKRVRKSHRYLNESDYLGFLERYFCGDDVGAWLFSLDENKDIVIHREFHGGSGATTILIQKGDKLFIRKYAFGEKANKLRDQYAWIERYTPDLSLPIILQYTSQSQYFGYDMEFKPSAAGFYNFIHTNPTDASWAVLDQILKTLETTLYSATQTPMEPDDVHSYVDIKLRGNLKKISSLFPDLWTYDEIIINGAVYRNLPSFFICVDRWGGLLEGKVKTPIHGDLTVENIICNPASPLNWYLIDPNPMNIYDHPYLDYAKLFQSFHLGYEPLRHNEHCRVFGNVIEFLVTRSHQYEVIFDLLREKIERELGQNALREILLHEIIHYARLLPYQHELNPVTAPIFYGCLVQLLNEFDEYNGA